MSKENPIITVEDHNGISEIGTMANGGPRPISRYFIQILTFPYALPMIYLIMQLILISSIDHNYRRNSVYDDSHHTSNAEIDYMSFDRISTTVQYLEKRTQYRPKISIICGSGLGKKLSFKI